MAKLSSNFQNMSTSAFSNIITGSLHSVVVECSGGATQLVNLGLRVFTFPSLRDETRNRGPVSI